MAFHEKKIVASIAPYRQLLIAFLVIALISLAFLKFASEVMEGETLAFDRLILLALRDPANLSVPVGPKWLELAMMDITALGSFAVLTLITAFAASYLVVVRKSRTALMLVASIVSGALANSLLKAFFVRLRPDVVPHLVEVNSASFPSGHAMNAAMIYLTLGVLLAGAETARGPRIYLMAVAITLALLVGCSRVYLGVHWPSDVVAGWGAGAAWALLCSYASRALEPKR